MAGSRNLQGIALASAATVLWAGNFIVGKAIYASMNPAELSFWRWFLAAVVLSPIALTGCDRHCWQQVRQHWRYFFTCSSLGMTILTLAIYQAAHTTSATNQTLIAISSPVFVLLGNWLILGNKPTPRMLLGVVITLSGIYFLLVRGQLNPAQLLQAKAGDALMLVSASVFAAYTLLLQRRPMTIAPLQQLFVMICFAAFQSGIVAAVINFWQPSQPFNLPGDSLIAVLYLAIGPSILGYFAWNKAIAFSGSQTTAICYFMLPVYGAIMAQSLLNETLSLLHLISFILIISGVSLATLKGPIHAHTSR